MDTAFAWSAGLLVSTMIWWLDNYLMRREIERLKEQTEASIEILHEVTKMHSVVIDRTREHRLLVLDVMHQHHEWLVDILNGKPPRPMHLRLVKNEEEKK